MAETCRAVAQPRVIDTRILPATGRSGGAEREGVPSPARAAEGAIGCQQGGGHARVAVAPGEPGGWARNPQPPSTRARTERRRGRRWARSQSTAPAARPPPARRDPRGCSSRQDDDDARHPVRHAHVVVAVGRPCTLPSRELARVCQSPPGSAPRAPRAARPPVRALACSAPRKPLQREDPVAGGPEIRSRSRAPRRAAPQAEQRLLHRVVGVGVGAAEQLRQVLGDPGHPCGTAVEGGVPAAEAVECALQPDECPFPRLGVIGRDREVRFRRANPAAPPATETSSPGSAPSSTAAAISRTARWASPAAEPVSKACHPMPAASKARRPRPRARDCCCCGRDELERCGQATTGRRKPRGAAVVTDGA